MLWKKFDCITDDRVYLACDDECYYARDFISGGGYGASDDNNLITNFKKPVARRGHNDWKYKVRAVARFADDLLTVLPDEAVVAAIPTSKSRSDPEYDSRLDDTLVRVVELNPSIRVEQPIERVRTVQPLHHGGKRRVNEVANSLRWIGFELVPDHIILIDDIITCGSHYKACQSLIRSQHPDIAVYGVFWARTVWPT